MTAGAKFFAPLFFQPWWNKGVAAKLLCLQFMLQPSPALQRAPIAYWILFPSYFDFQSLLAFDLATVTDTKEGYHMAPVTQY